MTFIGSPSIRESNKSHNLDLSESPNIDLTSSALILLLPILIAWSKRLNESLTLPSLDLESKFKDSESIVTFSCSQIIFK